MSQENIATVHHVFPNRRFVDHESYYIEDVAFILLVSTADLRAAKKWVKEMEVPGAPAPNGRTIYHGAIINQCIRNKSLG